LDRQRIRGSQQRTIEASSAGVNKGMTVTIRLPLPMKENHKD
jgi:hypothetical protein